MIDQLNIKLNQDNAQPLINPKCNYIPKSISLYIASNNFIKISVEAISKANINIGKDCLIVFDFS